MEGVLPFPNDSVILAACDSMYFEKFSFSFIYSAINAGHAVHLHVINPDGRVLECFTSYYVRFGNKVSFTSSTHDLSKLTLDQQKTFYACARFFVARRMLKSQVFSIVLDIDSVIIKNLSSILTNGKLGLLHRPWLPEQNMKFAAGAVAILQKDIGFNLLNYMCKLIARSNLSWFTDQLVLEQAVRKFDLSYYQFDPYGFERNTDEYIFTQKGLDKELILKNNKQLQLSIKDFSYEKVCFVPDIHLPFKAGKLMQRKEIFSELRCWWNEFAQKQREKSGYEKIIVPNWLITPNILNNFDNNLSNYLVPHRERSQWCGDRRAKFYMQTSIPYVFTVDDEGWGGNLSWKNKFVDWEYCPGASSVNIYRELQNKFLNGQSKFNSIATTELVMDQNYFLVPLQIPTDQTIKLHSNISVEDFVANLLLWYSQKPKRKFILLFKGHPLNKEVMKPFMKMVERIPGCYYTDSLSPQSALLNSKGVILINSGIGVEAILANKPVIAFGSAEYSPCVLRGTFDYERLDEQIELILQSKVKTSQYPKWIDFFISNSEYLKDDLSN